MSQQTLVKVLASWLKDGCFDIVLAHHADKPKDPEEYLYYIQRMKKIAASAIRANPLKAFHEHLLWREFVLLQIMRMQQYAIIKSYIINFFKCAEFPSGTSRGLSTKTKDHLRREPQGGFNARFGLGQVCWGCRRRALLEVSML